MTKPSPQPPLLIITDLDGTLLDHHSYRFDSALPALRRAAANAVPVVPNTSKTAAELQALRQALRLDSPFIVENGSAIWLPDNAANRPDSPRTQSTERWVEIRLGVSIASIHQRLAIAREHYRFTGFADWSVDELIAHTGLDRDAAIAAQQRQYSEALLWQDSEERKQSFIERMARAGLHTLQGGRFLSVLGAQADKGRALERLRTEYAQRWGTRPTVIALGDSENDIAMLQAADIAVVIHNDTRPAPSVDAPEVIYSRLAGPAGWNETIQALLDRFDLP